MSYAALHRMKNSSGLRERLIACAAEQGIAVPDLWVNENIWKIVVQPGWVTDWSYAEDTMTANDNPDIGARNDVIDDAQILSAVQAVNNANNTTP